MVEVEYNDLYEKADIAGKTITEARKLYEETFAIPNKAVARLNGRKIKSKLEVATTLVDEDRLVFKRIEGNKNAYLIGAFLLALVITGSVFAYGYTAASTSLNVTAVGSNFADVSVNNSSLPNWVVRGMFKGSTGSGTLFDVNTSAANYTGDLVVTVSLANVDQLVEVYRFLGMSIGVRDSSDNAVDINGDGNADSSDFAFLTLNNGAVDLYITQTSADIYTVKVLRGSYISHTWGTGWNAGYENPLLYCEVAQR